MSVIQDFIKFGQSSLTGSQKVSIYRNKHGKYLYIITESSLNYTNLVRQVCTDEISFWDCSESGLSNFVCKFLNIPFDYISKYLSTTYINKFIKPII